MHDHTDWCDRTTHHDLDGACVSHIVVAGPIGAWVTKPRHDGADADPVLVVDAPPGARVNLHDAAVLGRGIVELVARVSPPVPGPRPAPSAAAHREGRAAAGA